MHDLYNKLSFWCHLLGFCRCCPASQIRSLKAISGPRYNWLNDEKSYIEAPIKVKSEVRNCARYAWAPRFIKIRNPNIEKHSFRSSTNKAAILVRARNLESAMVSVKKPLNLNTIENTLHHLNYRWNLEALALWKGDKLPFEPHKIYEGYESFLNLNTLSSIDSLEESVSKTRLRFTLIDHYLQRALLPHETEMRTWMRGAAAHVDGEKIYFPDVIPWCQKSSTSQKRLIL